MTRFLAPRGYPRPWPVNPTEYPLSGPSRGSVYTPPELEDEDHTPLWIKAVWLVMAAAVFYLVFCSVVAISAAIASALF